MIANFHNTFWVKAEGRGGYTPRMLALSPRPRDASALPVQHDRPLELGDGGEHHQKHPARGRARVHLAAPENRRHEAPPACLPRLPRCPAGRS
jgi:hypothetical protein